MPSIAAAALNSRTPTAVARRYWNGQQYTQSTSCGVPSNSRDSEFGIAEVVEIAIRALSPAANDTFTGVASVDWLAKALLTLAEATPECASPFGRLVRIAFCRTQLKEGPGRTSAGPSRTMGLEVETEFRC
jgi:hypothetical protein